MLWLRKKICLQVTLSVLEVGSTPKFQALPDVSSGSAGVSGVDRATVQLCGRSLCDVRSGPGSGSFVVDRNSHVGDVPETESGVHSGRVVHGVPEMSAGTELKCSRVAGWCLAGWCEGRRIQRETRLS